MKRAILGVVVCVLIAAPSMLGGQEAATRVSGLVIDPGADHVQIKSGWNEITLFYGDASQFLKKDGTAADKTIVEICQIADASFVMKESRFLLVKYQVLTESYCRK
ncbi:MAG: hypothetical protein EPN93_19735 [Spirochaetes bacterium]|nr:MAG: hypothetical protein EPN93_19735 [Spirochaetota bacterium]